ncbi:MAG: hypothetical protein WKF31_13385 [Thermoleophilaceae bacterium]
MAALAAGRSARPIPHDSWRSPRWSAALAVVAFAATTGPSGPELSLTAGGGGPLSIQNSEDGSLLTVGGMAPGDTEAGAVTITNTGSRPGDLAVSSVDLEDLPGMGGGQLSERLQLSVTERGAPSAADEIVFSGPLGAMDRIDLGRLAPDDARTFRFSVSFPNGGTPSSPLTGDNVYQGAQASVGYRWDAVASSDEERGGSGAAGDRARGRGGDGPSGGSRRSGAPEAAAPVAVPPAAAPPPPTTLTARGQPATHRSRSPGRDELPRRLCATERRGSPAAPGWRSERCEPAR